MSKLPPMKPPHKMAARAKDLCANAGAAELISIPQEIDQTCRNVLRFRRTSRDPRGQPPPTMRVPTCVPPRKERGWRSCEHTRGVRALFRITSHLSPMRREDEIPKVDTKPGRKRCASRDDLLSQRPWFPKRHYRTR